MIDITLSNSRSRLCNGVSRRDFLRVGGLGVFGISLASALAREKLLAADAAPAARRAKAKSVILIYLGGGLSHHDSFDPKPDAAEEIRGKYKTIPTSVTGRGYQRHVAEGRAGDGQGLPRAFGLPRQ